MWNRNSVFDITRTNADPSREMDLSIPTDYCQSQRITFLAHHSIEVLEYAEMRMITSLEHNKEFHLQVTFFTVLRSTILSHIGFVEAGKNPENLVWCSRK